MSAPSMTEFDHTRLDDEYRYLVDKIAECRKAFLATRDRRDDVLKLLRAKMALDKFEARTHE